MEWLSNFERKVIKRGIQQGIQQGAVQTAREDILEVGVWIVSLRKTTLAYNILSYSEKL